MATAEQRAAWVAASAALAAIDRERAALVAPTEARWLEARTALDEIEEGMGEPIGVCEGCSMPVFDGEKSFRYEDGPILCEACSPTYADMLVEAEGFRSHDDADHVMTPEEARRVCDAHVAAGGSLENTLAT